MYAATYNFVGHFTGHFRGLMEQDEIVLGLRDRNPDVLDGLIERYHYRLMRYLLHITANPQTAEDVFQETWIRVLERGRQYNGKAKFGAWLFAIARHLVIDLARKKSPASLESLLGGTEQDRPVEIPDAGQPSPFESTAAGEESAMMLRALNRLGPAYREVLVLRFQEEMSLAEIAAVLDANMSTVKTRLYRGLDALRSQFEGDPFEGERL